MKIVFTGGILSAGFMQGCTRRLQYFLEKECKEFKGQEIVIELVAKNFMIKRIIVTSPNPAFKASVNIILSRHDIIFIP